MVVAPFAVFCETLQTWLAKFLLTSSCRNRKMICRCMVLVLDLTAWLSAYDYYYCIGGVYRYKCCGFENTSQRLYLCCPCGLCVDIWHKDFASCFFIRTEHKILNKKLIKFLSLLWKNAIFNAEIFCSLQEIL